MHHYIADEDWEKIENNLSDRAQRNFKILKDYFGVDLREFATEILDIAERQMVEVLWEKEPELA